MCHLQARAPSSQHWGVTACRQLAPARRGAAARCRARRRRSSRSTPWSATSAAAAPRCRPLAAACPVPRCAGLIVQQMPPYCSAACLVGQVPTQTRRLLRDFSLVSALCGAVPGRCGLLPAAALCQRVSWSIAAVVQTVAPGSGGGRPQSPSPLSPHHSAPTPYQHQSRQPASPPPQQQQQQQQQRRDYEQPPVLRSPRRGSSGRLSGAFGDLRCVIVHHRMPCCACSLQYSVYSLPPQAACEHGRDARHGCDTKVVTRWCFLFVFKTLPGQQWCHASARKCLCMT